MKRYWVNEIFYSLQGEGLRAGTANVFVRFKGCNLKCSEAPGPKSIGGFDCDTEFESGVAMSAVDIVSAASAACGSDSGNVIFTGGEPAVQLDRGLVEAFKSSKWYTVIETNGSIDVSGLGLDFICVSPKVAEHCVRQLTADEVRYVRGAGQGLPKPACDAGAKLLSPAFNGLESDTGAIRTCVDLVKKHPEWRLSIQQHKMWGIR